MAETISRLFNELERLTQTGKGPWTTKFSKKLSPVGPVCHQTIAASTLLLSVDNNVVYLVCSWSAYLMCKG